MISFYSSTTRNCVVAHTIFVLEQGNRSRKKSYATVTTFTLATKC